MEFGLFYLYSPESNHSEICKISFLIIKNSTKQCKKQVQDLWILIRRRTDLILSKQN